MKKNIKIILFFLVLLFFCCANNIYAKAKSCKTHGDCLLSEFCDVNTVLHPDRADNNSVVFQMKHVKVIIVLMGMQAQDMLQ